MFSHTQTHVRPYKQTGKHTHTCECTHLHTYTHAHTETHIHPYTNARKRAQLYGARFSDNMSSASTTSQPPQAVFTFLSFPVFSVTRFVDIYSGIFLFVARQVATVLFCSSLVLFFLTVSRLGRHKAHLEASWLFQLANWSAEHICTTADSIRSCSLQIQIQSPLQLLSFFFLPLFLSSIFHSSVFLHPSMRIHSS